jgi:Uma2 family endonuclease
MTIQVGWRRIGYSAIITVEPRRRNTMATAELLELMTAEEFGKRPDPGYPEELVRGRVIAMTVPDRRHGYVCLNVGRILGEFVAKRGVGRVMSNDSAIITERNPDSVRGADVAYYSFERLPKGPLAPGYGPEVPELVVEVRSPSDRWRDIHEKVTEYLNAGVTLVIVLDPGPNTAHLFGADDAPRMLGAEDELILPGILEEFRVRVGDFFE